MTNGIDDHLGQRLRQRRWMLGLTQTQVGDRVGIKFQQIQKYETGQNRISAARLWDLAQALDVPVSYFYDGLSAGAALDIAADSAAAADPLAERETIELARAYLALPAGARGKLLDFLRALASDAPTSAEPTDRPLEPTAEPRPQARPRPAERRRAG
jgi:transcriptional regulator with XRE-family HTH domain